MLTQGCPTGILQAAHCPQEVKLWPLGSWMALVSLIALAAMATGFSKLPIPLLAATSCLCPRGQGSSVHGMAWHGEPLN